MGTCLAKFAANRNKWDLIMSASPLDDYALYCPDYTQLFMKISREVINPAPVVPGTDVQTPKGKDILPVKTFKLLNGIVLRFTDVDEDHGDIESFDTTKGIAGLIKANIFLKAKEFPMQDDKLHHFPSEEVGKKAGIAAMGGVLPKALVEWDEIQSDEAISLLAFNGLGMVYLTGMPDTPCDLHDRVEARTQIDLNFLVNYNVRRPYEKYGCIAYFANDKSPVAIYWSHAKKLVVKGDKDWEHVKAVFKASLAAAVTVKEHLVHVHWYIGNTLIFASRQSFHANHPIGRLLKPHSYEAVGVNWASSQILLPVGGLAYRVFAFDESTWKNAFTDCIRLCKFQTFPDEIRSKNLPPEVLEHFPYKEDGEAVWFAIHRYVHDYISIFYKNDEDVCLDEDIQQYWGHYTTMPCWTNYGLPPLSKASLIDLLTHTIFWVTAGHEMVGGLIQYFMSPAGLGAKILENKEMVDIDTHFASLALLALTGINMPMLINDWSHIHIHDKLSDSESRDLKAVLDKFQADLHSVSHDIADRNSKVDKTGKSGRRKEFEAFNPKYLECSVSV